MKDRSDESRRCRGIHLMFHAFHHPTYILLILNTELSPRISLITPLEPFKLLLISEEYYHMKTCNGGQILKLRLGHYLFWV